MVRETTGDRAVPQHQPGDAGARGSAGGAVDPTRAGLGAEATDRLQHERVRQPRESGAAGWVGGHLHAGLQGVDSGEEPAVTQDGGLRRHCQRKPEGNV